MASTVFRIIMHGLIALAPTAPGDQNHITALLLDTQMSHDTHDTLCASVHHPELTFRIAEIPENERKCSAAGCNPVGTECACGDGIFKKKITLEFSGPLSDPLPEQLPLDDNNVNNYGLPTASTIGSRRFVANLTKAPFNLKLLDSAMLDNHLFARMEVPVEKLVSCSLSNREDQGGKYVIPMGIRAIGERSRASDRTQAFAQMIVAKFDVPEGQQIRITISNFDGSDPQSMVLAAGEFGYLIRLSNEPDELERGSPCDDGIARHFAHYYDLAENPPAWEKRLIPHARFTQGIRFDGSDPEPAAAEAEECKNLAFTMMDRPICPMADFL